MTQNTKIEQRFSVLILNTLDFDSISALLANLLYSKSSKRIISVEDFHKDPLMAEWVSHESSTKFGNLFKEQGSDKSRTHDYYLVYQPIIDRLLDQKYTLKITEIGLGTNNLDTLSNLGAMGIPGASARAFRDFNQNIYFHGADVDKRILFEEERVFSSNGIERPVCIRKLTVSRNGCDVCFFIHNNPSSFCVFGEFSF